MVLLQLGQESHSETMSDLTSSSPENENALTLEEQLKLKETEICEVLSRTKSVELDRDKNYQMVCNLSIKRMRGKVLSTGDLFLKTFLSLGSNSFATILELISFVAGKPTQKCHSDSQRIDTVLKATKVCSSRGARRCEKTQS